MTVPILFCQMVLPLDSFCSLSYSRSIAFVNRVLHRVRSTASSFNFQHPVFSLQSSSSPLRLLPRLPLTSIIPSTFPSVPWFRRQFLLKMCPIQLAFLFPLYVWYSSLPWLYLILLHFSHVRSNCLGEVSIKHIIKMFGNGRVSTELECVRLLYMNEDALTSR
jgi:hypothetical protein